MKKIYIIILIFLLAAGGLVTWKWNTWFKNPPEEAYTTPRQQDRIILSLGEQSTTRRISWRCDSMLTTQAFVQIIPQHTTDTLMQNATGTVVSSRTGKSAFYNTEWKNLTPGIEYLYRVVNDTLHSRWYSFRMPADDTPLSFLYLGDIQDRTEGKTAGLFRNIHRKYPDVNFWALVGDVIERPTDTYWTYWFSTMDSITQTTPIIAATGNHEYLKGLPKQLDPRWTFSFSNPENGPEDFEGRSYFINFKDLCFIVMDTDGIQGPESLYNHYHWLKETLASSDKKWKIVMMHHPVYSVRDGRNNFYVRWTFKSLFEKYGVDLVLQGHDHGYSRITTKTTGREKTTPVYIVSSCSPKAYSIGFNKRHDRLGANINLYQYITISGDTLRYQANTFDHQVYDELILLSNGQVTDKAEELPEKLDYLFGDSKKERKKAEAYSQKAQERINSRH